MNNWVLSQILRRKQRARVQLVETIIDEIVLAMKHRKVYEGARLTPKEIRSAVAAAHRSMTWRDPKKREQRFQEIKDHV